MELIVIGDDSRGILAAMLQDDQPVVQVLNDVTVAGDSENPAHNSGVEKMERDVELGPPHDGEDRKLREGRSHVCILPAPCRAASRFPSLSGGGNRYCSSGCL